MKQTLISRQHAAYRARIMRSYAADRAHTLRQRSFRQWLHDARITNDAAGDLIKDLRSDLRTDPDEFPRPRTVSGLTRYLAQQGCCDGAIAAAPVVWGRYRQWTKARRDL